MIGEAQDAERDQTLTSLRHALLGLWRLGSNVVVGWRPSRVGIELMTVPMARLFGLGVRHHRVLNGDRMMGPNTFAEVAATLDQQPIEVRLPMPVGDDPDMVAAAAIGEAIEPFTITQTNQRAAFLVDIVEFSLAGAAPQASQLATVEFALNLAAELVTKHASPLTLMRSTTGDGFYVWNRVKGMDGDLALFMTFLTFLTLLAFLQRSAASRDTVPLVRACIGIGSHYTYHQIDRTGRGTNEFIVGDVTIALARLVAVTRPRQILVRDFHRLATDAMRPIGVGDLLTIVSERMNWMNDLDLLGTSIDRIALYITGPHDDDGRYEGAKLYFTDKHGLEHTCCNLKLNVFPHAGEPIFCGLRHANLRSRDGFPW